MLYLTCTMISSVDLAHYGVSRATDWVSVDCGTSGGGILILRQRSLRKQSVLSFLCLSIRFLAVKRCKDCNTKLDHAKLLSLSIQRNGTVNPLYNDIRYNSTIRYNVNSV